MHQIHIFATLFALLSGIAIAAEPSPPPTEDIFSYRYIGKEEHTTSDCIGSRKTPMCVAETYFASSATGDNRFLWEIAHGQRLEIKFGEVIKYASIVPKCYRLMGAWQFLEYRMPTEPNPWGILENDVALSFLTTHFIDGVCGDTFYPDAEQSFLIRNSPNGWYIVDRDNRIDFVRNPLSAK